MNRATGKPITRREHIRQSVVDILTTPVGSRVMRRDYGSHLFDLVDSPGNPVGTLRTVAAAADALERWEPRAKLRRGRMVAAEDGRAVLRLDLALTDDASPLTADVPLGAS